MILPLTRTIVSTDEEGTQISRLPSSEEMMNKINEIVQAVNMQEKLINKMRSDHNNWVLNEAFRPKRMV